MATAMQLSRWSIPMKITTPLHSVIFRALLIVVGISVLAFLYLRTIAGRVDQRVLSQDGRMVAECRTFDFAAATDTEQTTVQIRNRFNPFRHTVFAGLNYGAKVSISWQDPRTLLIRCINCKNLDIRRKQPEWHGVSIIYKGD